MSDTTLHESLIDDVRTAEAHLRDQYEASRAAIDTSYDEAICVRLWFENTDFDGARWTMNAARRLADQGAEDVEATAIYHDEEETRLFQVSVEIEAFFPTGDADGSGEDGGQQ